MSDTRPGRVRFGPYEADLHTHELWKFGIKVKLVGQPFEVLAILLSKPGELVTREALRDRLWPGDTYVDFNHGLNAAVNRLREALSDSADEPRYVETLPRRGYRFIAEVERLSGEKVGERTAPPPSEMSSEPVASSGISNGMVQSTVGVAGFTQVGASAQPETLEVRDDRAAELQKAGGHRRLLVGGILLLVIAFGAMLGLLLREVYLAKMASREAPAAQRIQPLTTLTDETNEPAFSPDGNFVAFHRAGTSPANSGIFVRSLASDQLLQLTSNPGDEFPVWSPDGQTVAFARFNQEDRAYVWFYRVPLARAQAHVLYKENQELSVTVGGMEERKIDTGGVTPTRGEFDWSPDGKTIAFSGGNSIFLLSLENHAVMCLTNAPSSVQDGEPAFSPDGKTLLFIRRNQGRTPDQIFSIPAAGGDPSAVWSDEAGLLSPARWLPDGQSIVFSSSRGSHPGLWRTSPDGKEPPTQINDSGWYPAISRRGYRLAYQRESRGLNIWELELAPGSRPLANKPRVLVPSTSQTDQGPGPQISPDGKKLVYMSDRSGTMEIWVSDRDGSNPIQLTALGHTGTPRWSPDSQRIVFDRQGSIFVVGVQGGAPVLVSPANFDNECASWSVDGKWVYFASSRTGATQAWKAHPDGSQPTQITWKGGHAALESFDGKFLYYAKNQYAAPEIWQVPVEGGAETLMSPLVRPASWASWAVVDGGILFAGSSGRGNPAVSFFDFATHRVTIVGVLNTVPFWLGASHDGKTVVFDQPGSEQDQVMLVENFR